MGIRRARPRPHGERERGLRRATPLRRARESGHAGVLARRRRARRGAPHLQAGHYAAMLMERQAALMGSELAVARDELRGELDNLRAAAEWILAEDEHVAMPVLEAFYTFLWMHSWFDGAETLGRLGRTAGFDADDPGSTSAVALAAATCR